MEWLERDKKELYEVMEKFYILLGGSYTLRFPKWCIFKFIYFIAYK